MVVFINLLVFVMLLAALAYMQKHRVKFSIRVFTALGIGALYGMSLQLFTDQQSIKSTLEWTSLAGDGYVRLIQMMVMPLIFVSILSAIVNLKDGQKGLAKMSLLIIGLLVGTALIAALVGVASANIFGLNASWMHMGAAEVARGVALEQRLNDLESTSLVQRIVTLIPTNPFQDLTGARDTSTIGVVIFAAFLGVAALGTRAKHPDSYQTFKKWITSIHDVVMRLVTIVLRLTPYGILALIGKVVATSSITEILNLGTFVIASYAAIVTMFGIHLLLLLFARLNPLVYFRKVLPVLTFAFTSRTSAGTIPLNVKVQTRQLGVDEGVANLSASLGSSIGQNGCGAIYPAMLAVMIAPTLGIDPLSISFILKLIVVIAISSFGVAGVGGGATFAALIVLSALNFPVALVGLLISIEPLIDMGRTALNVNGSMVAGLLSSRIMGNLNQQEYKSKPNAAAVDL